MKINDKSDSYSPSFEKLCWLGTKMHKYITLSLLGALLAPSSFTHAAPPHKNKKFRDEKGLNRKSHAKLDRKAEANEVAPLIKKEKESKEVEEFKQDLKVAKAYRKEVKEYHSKIINLKNSTEGSTEAEKQDFILKNGGRIKELTKIHNQAKIEMRLLAAEPDAVDQIYSKNKSKLDEINTFIKSCKKRRHAPARHKESKVKRFLNSITQPKFKQD